MASTKTSLATTSCTSCGGELHVGDFPFCHGDPSRHVKASTGIEDVTWPGGKVFENLGHDPVRCDSPADLKRELKARNLEPCVRHVPQKGSDKSPHTTSWAGMDPYTLKAAEALVQYRGPVQPAESYITHLTFSVTEEAATVRAEKGTFGDVA